MSTNTKIEWTEATWNPCTGCTKISPGCKHCYAERLSIRLMNMGKPKYKNGFKLTMHADVLDIPLNWLNPQKIFVNSMSDLFHKDVTKTFIKKVFKVMNLASWHQYQILTKRPERLVELNKELSWAGNIWMGTTIENNDYVYRADYLRKSSAHIKFLSLEPLLGPLPDLNLQGIDWVIVGGESGVGARPIEKEWILEIRDMCESSNTPFFFKQWGGVNKREAGRVLNGKTYNEYPIVTIQESSTQLVCTA